MKIPKGRHRKGCICFKCLTRAKEEQEEAEQKGKEGNCKFCKKDMKNDKAFKKCNKSMTGFCIPEN